MAKETNVVAANAWYVKQIREVGEFLMKNAEKLAADVPCFNGIDIHASIDLPKQTEIRVESRLSITKG